MNKCKNVKDTENWPVTLASSLQYLLIFLPTLFLPLIDVLNLKQPIASLTSFAAFSCIFSAIITLLIASKKIGAGLFFPTFFPAPLYLITINTIQHPHSLPEYIGLGIVIGAVQFVLTPFAQLFCNHFPKKLAIFVLTLLGIYIAHIGVVGIITTSHLNPIIHKHIYGEAAAFNPILALIGLITLVSILFFNLQRDQKYKSLCILYGCLIGWLLTIISHNLDPVVAHATKHSPWFCLPSLHDISSPKFNIRRMPAAIAMAIVLFLQFCAIVSVTNSPGETIQDKKRNLRRGNIVASLGIMISSLTGSPQTPNAALYGSQLISNYHSRKISWLYSLVLLIIAFSPKAMLYLLTMPSTAKGAVFLLVGSMMFITGVQSFKIHTMNRYQSISFTLSLLAGAGLAINPHMQVIKHSLLSNFTDPMFPVATALYVLSLVLEAVHKKTKIWQANNV